jgi:membrane protein implicated in regulation of membrane protease activity
MPSPEPRDRIKAGPAIVAVVAVIALLYSLLIAQQLLFGAVAVGLVFVVYLLWRLVRATERIADAVEHDE